MDWLKSLKGKKTYIAAAAIALVTVAYYFGWIDAEAWNMLLGLLGAGGLAAARAAIGHGENNGG